MARRPTPKQAELLSEIDAGLITSSKLEGGWRNARRDPSFANVAPAAEAVIRHGWAEPTNPAGKLRVLRLTATGRARPRRTPHPVTRHGDHAMTTTTPAPVTDITSLLPIGRVAEVTTWDAGTQTRITGTVTGYARDGRRLPRLRPIAGVWVGDSWVSTEEALAPETRARLCGPGEAAVPLTNAGVLVTLEDTRPGDVLYVAFPAGDSVVQALGPVDAVDPDGQWVGLDGEMTLSTGVPFFAIRRVTAAEQREAQ